MAHLTPLPALALAACLLVPVAAAAAAHEAEGRFVASGGVAMRGTLDLHGPGLLELEPPGEDGGVAVAFAGLAHGVLVDRTRDKVRAGPHGASTSVEETATAIEAGGAGSIENVLCGPLCRVAAFAAPGEGLLGARGFVDAALRPTAQERVFRTATSTQNDGMQLRYVVPAGSVEVAHAQFADPVPRVSGRVTLVIADATFDLVADGKRTTLDARWGNETTAAAAGEPVLLRHHARHAALTLDGAALALAPGAPFRLSFPAGADGRLDGVVSSRDSLGALTVAGKRHELGRDSVLLEGSLATRLAGAPVPGASGLDVEVQGEATRAAVSGASVLPRFPAVAVEAGGLLALAGLAFLGRLFVAPLYHRLGPSDMLANPNRRRIHEAIRARPGIDVGALVAAVGLSRVLVRHHLRMLETRRLVRATAWRRRRTYALAGVGAGPGLAACELKDATRRRVACAVARSAGATQKDLARALGLSQRLVSYHLACLGDSSLVRVEGRNPRVYVATEALARALDAEGAPARAKGRPLASALEKEGEGMAGDVAAPA